MTRFVDLLPARLRPFAKAAVPFVANLAYGVASGAVTGGYDTTELRVNVLGLAAAALTYLVPNRPKE